MFSCIKRTLKICSGSDLYSKFRADYASPPPPPPPLFSSSHCMRRRQQNCIGTHRSSPLVVLAHALLMSNNLFLQEQSASSLTLPAMNQPSTNGIGTKHSRANIYEIAQADHQVSFTYPPSLLSALS